MPGMKPGPTTIHYDNLLKDTIARATHELMNEDGVTWCLSVFEDNAGIIEFDERYGIAFKVETHNHPSAIEPYGGSATGIGGVIRDIMGCGLGAKPVANTDVFCVGLPDFPMDKLPAGVLHPRRVLKGVVSGVRDYGNRMGIPTVNGAVYFDPRYMGNPLVFCGCVGLIPRDRIAKAAQPGDLVVVAGGRTGRDGIHGATFSSAELTDTHADEFSHAVQIGNAITEKTVLDVQMQARDYPGGCLYTACTDCGAGGLSSAVGEMAAKTGAVIDLETVPLKYAGLRYDEIWISEAQERMVMSVPPANWPTLRRCRGRERRSDGDRRVHGRQAARRQIRRRRRRRNLDGFPARRHPADAQAGDVATARNAHRAGRARRGARICHRAEAALVEPEQRQQRMDHPALRPRGAGRIAATADGRTAGPSTRRGFDRLGSKRGLAIGCGLCPNSPTSSVLDGRTRRRRSDPQRLCVGAIRPARRSSTLCWGNWKTQTCSAARAGLSGLLLAAQAYARRSSPDGFAQQRIRPRPRDAARLHDYLRERGVEVASTGCASRHVACPATASWASQHVIYADARPTPKARLVIGIPAARTCRCPFVRAAMLRTVHRLIREGERLRHTTSARTAGQWRSPRWPWADQSTSKRTWPAARR